ncbi:MAG: glycosyl hydrolase 53 family protein [bacterium]|nr:glycosyl hydrolase 53 family protein [bacterium]
MIGLLPLFLCCCVLLPAAARAAPVTFRVDMGPYLAAGYFDPASDRLELRGDFDGWAAAQRILQAHAGGSVYAVVADLPAGGIAYKFLIVRSGGAEIWEEDIPNRTWQVPAGGGSPPTAPFADLAATLSADARVVGADLSFVPQLSALGAAFSRDGQQAPLLALVAEAGVGLVRLRLWHTPTEPWHGLEATVAFAHQVQAAGFALMLDLHYSDGWADPGQQTMPAAWQGTPVATLADSVAAYTAHVVARFVDEGLTPRYVQLGNEIDAGLLWDAGRVGWPGSAWDTPTQWDTLTTLLQAAAGAARAALPPGAPTELVVHLAPGGDNARCRWFLDRLAAAGVDYDVIGLSYYPWWHGTLWQLQANLRDLRPRYGKPLLVVETAYPWTLAAADATGNFVTAGTSLHAGYPATPPGQRDFLRDVRRVVETSGGVGVVCWEPAFIPVDGGPGNPWENLTLFDFEGEALPGLWFGAAGNAASDAPAPAGASLLQNRPNPFNPATEIRFRLEHAGPIRLKIYDVAGRLVRTLVDAVADAGWHRLGWAGTVDAGRALPSGIYLYELVTPQGVEQRRMVLVR